MNQGVNYETESSRLAGILRKPLPFVALTGVAVLWFLVKLDDPPPLYQSILTAFVLSLLFGLPAWLIVRGLIRLFAWMVR